jgi:hypothetical protein
MLDKISGMANVARHPPTTHVKFTLSTTAGLDNGRLAHLLAHDVGAPWEYVPIQLTSSPFSMSSSRVNYLKSVKQRSKEVTAHRIA